MMHPYAHALRDGAPVPVRTAGLILIVEDETGVRELMSRWLRAGGYQVVCASSADEALACAAAHAPAVAVCDVRMPGHDGLWLATRLRQDYPDMAVIMATGVHDVGAAVASLRHGVVDYLTKPFGRDRLRDAVVRALEWHRAASDQRRWREQLDSDGEAGCSRLSSIVHEIPIESEAAVEALVCRLASIDAHIPAHAGRVARLAMQMARVLGVSSDDLVTIRCGALLHDLGRLALPRAILQKPAPLTPDELVIVRRHPTVGAQLLVAHPFLSTAAVIVRTTHERPDGLGYPAALRGESLPIGSRIVAAADAFDTMTHARIFRGAVTARDALLELDRCSGTQFDPRVVDVLVQQVAAEP